MPGRDPKDVQVSQEYRYGPKNTEVAVLNDNAAYSGVRGYPSDDEYMKTVRDSNLERDAASMRAQADEAQRKTSKRAKPSSFKTGGVVQRTGLAMVHKGETILPAGEKTETPYRTIPRDAGWLTCPENKGKYTGDNAPWRR